MNEQVFVWLGIESWTEFWWLVLGFTAQLSFAMRWIVQWIVSERLRRSYVPIAFWYLSVFGGLMLLAYAIYRRDPVFILGQAMGATVYIRNLALIYRSRREDLAAANAADAAHRPDAAE